MLGFGEDHLPTAGDEWFAFQIPLFQGKDDPSTGILWTLAWESPIKLILQVP